MQRADREVAGQLAVGLDLSDVCMP